MLPVMDSFVIFYTIFTSFSMVVVVPVVIVSIVNGFGLEITIESCMEVLAQAVFFWLVSSAMGGFFIFLALTTKNTVATVGGGLGIAYFLLVITSNYVNADIEIFSVVKYSLICQMFILGDWEHLNKGLFLGVSLITLISTLVMSTLVFERSELK